MGAPFHLLKTDYDGQIRPLGKLPVCAPLNFLDLNTLEGEFMRNAAEATLEAARNCDDADLREFLLKSAAAKLDVALLIDWTEEDRAATAQGHQLDNGGIRR